MSKADKKRISDLEKALQSMLDLVWSSDNISWQTMGIIEDNACDLLGIPRAAERHAAYAKKMGFEK